MNRKPELTKQESEGFERFVREHYVKMLLEAQYITDLGFRQDRVGILTYRSNQEQELAFRAVFNKLASPRIYLIDAWRKLSPEEHMVYSYPDPVEREKARAKAEEISKQAREMITT